MKHIHLDILASAHSVKHSFDLMSREWVGATDCLTQLGLINKHDYRRHTTTPLGDRLMDALLEATTKFLEAEGK